MTTPYRMANDDNRRYWRRRVNRQVRKARRTKLAARIALMLVFNLTVLALLVFAANRARDHIVESPEFEVRRLGLSGLEQTDEAALRADLGRILGGRLLELDLERIADVVRSRPWVLDCTIRRVVPDGLQIDVIERTTVARTRQDGESWVVDATGALVVPAAAEHGGLPRLTGLERYTEEQRRGLRRRGVDALARLGELFPSWAPAIESIDFSRGDCLAVKVRNHGPLLLLDPERVERNVGNYLNMASEIRNRVGDLSYVDLRWRGRITVGPEERL